MEDCSDGSHIISEEDLVFNDQNEACIFLRFKNCTGNIIILSNKDAETIIDPTEVTQAQLALSIDPQYKK